MKRLLSFLALCLIGSTAYGQQFNELDSTILKGIADTLYPGACVVVGTPTGILYEKAYGHFTYDPSSPAVQTSSMFDLASCTKVFATTMCAMKLINDGRLLLDEKVSAYVPAFGRNGKEEVTVKNLLLHNGGMPEYYTPKGDKTPEEIIDVIFSMKQKFPLGKYKYSCLNMVTLMRVMESVIHEPMYKFYEETYTKPLGLQRTMFTPPDSLKQYCLPTIPKPGKQGIVHDPLAAGLKGLSGNAGLFSTTGDLAVLCQLMLGYGQVKGIRIVDSATVAEFIRWQPDTASTRALGWGTNHDGESSAGSLFSRASFGHTGYTGTSVWCDPEKQIFVVLLTNRVYPDDRVDVTGTRIAVASAVVHALEESTKKSGGMDR